MIDFKIKTNDRFAMNNITGKDTIKSGMEIDLGEGAKLVYKSEDVKKAFGFPTIINFTIVFVSGVTAGILANWIYDKLCGNFKDNPKIIIERKEINLDKDKIKQVLDEVMKFY